VLQLRAVAGASPADFQTALQQVSYKNTSDNPATDDRVASVTVDDGTGNSNAALAFIHVTAVDDPPTLTVAPSATYLEQAPPATLSPVVTVSDPDNPVLTVAAVAIVDPLPGDESAGRRHRCGSQRRHPVRLAAAHAAADPERPRYGVRVPGAVPVGAVRLEQRRSDQWRRQPDPHHRVARVRRHHTGHAGHYADHPAV
jgi:hypothetical protein